MEHLNRVESTIAAEHQKKIDSFKKEGISSQKCKEYHYLFLNLLKRKPNLKKLLKKIKKEVPQNYDKGRKLLREINFILIDIDSKRDRCDEIFLKSETKHFKEVEKKIKKLLY
jgi:hypothetical protein